MDGGGMPMDGFPLFDRKLMPLRNGLTGCGTHTLLFVTAATSDDERFLMFSL